MRFRLSSILKRPKTLIVPRHYDAFLVTVFEEIFVFLFKTIRCVSKGTTFETVYTKVFVFISVSGVLVGTIGDNASKSHYAFQTKAYKC